MGDMDIIRETARQIGVASVSSATVRLILDYPRVKAPVVDDVDAALRRRAIVAAMISEFGHPASADTVYPDVYIACRNARDRRAAA
jgi:hypothetical protein